MTSSYDFNNIEKVIRNDNPGIVPLYEHLVDDDSGGDRSVSAPQYNT